MKYKNTQSLASAIIADAKSTVSDEFEEAFDNMVSKTMMSEHIKIIVDRSIE